MSKKTCSSRPFYYDCECTSTGSAGIDVLELLANAMKDEKKAIKFYRHMMSKSQCESDREMFREIREDEKKHYRWLQDIYRDLTCECYCVNDVDVKRPKGFCRAMKTAIYNEMQAVSDYENLAYNLTDMRHREIICRIIEEDRCHAGRIAALYQYAQECACKAQQSQNTCNCGYTCFCNCMPNCQPCQPDSNQCCPPPCPPPCTPNCGCGSKGSCGC